MAGEDVPTLEESAAAIASAIRSFHYGTSAVEGIGVATFPFDYMADLSSHYTDWAAAAAVHCQGMEEIWEELVIANVQLPVVVEHLDTIADKITDRLVAPVADVISGDLITAILNGLDPLDGLADAIGSFAAAFEEFLQSDRGSMDAVNRTLSQMKECICEGLSGGGDGRTCDLEGAVSQMLAGLGALFAQFLSPQKRDRGAEAKVNAEAHFKAMEESTDKILKDRKIRSPGIMSWVLDLLGCAVEFGRQVAEPVIGAAEDSAAGSMGEIKARLGKGAGGLADTLLKPLQWLTASGVATPETTPRRCAAAYLFAIALGMVAHGIAAIGHIRIFGSGGINLGYLSAFIGRLAGFGPLASTIQGTLYNSYLGVPLKQLVNSKARPYLPGIGDLTRMRYKRIFNRRPEDPNKTQPPMSFQEAMSYYGYSDPWIDIIEDDLYREPMARDLLMMAEVAQFDRGWWTHKTRRLGYDDTDAPIMVDALQRRSARTQILNFYRQLYNLAREGFISPYDFRKRAGATKLAPMALDFGVDAVSVELERVEKRELLAVVKQKYVVGQIDDKGLREVLDTIYYDPDRGERVFRLERLKKFNRVYYLTEAEEARKALPARRTGFLSGRLTLEEYKAELILSGMEPDVADLLAGSANDARDRAQLAEFGRYALPTLRDECLHGMIAVDGYLARLRTAGFPQEYMGDERRLMVARIARRKEGIVRSEQLGAYRTAYVLGLVDEELLDGALQDAGVSEAGRIAEHVVLDFRRAAEEQRRADKADAEAAKLLADEKRAQEKARKEAQRKAQRAAREAERKRRAYEKQLAQEAAELAAELKAAAEERRPDWPGDVARIQDQIERVYSDAGEFLPDDVWSLARDIDDELAQPGGPDPITLDSLIGRTEQALARYVGAAPPEPT